MILSLVLRSNGEVGDIEVLKGLPNDNRSISNYYMFSRNAVTMNAPDGTPSTTDGRAVTIWRRESDGEWRCAVDIWNS